MGNDGGSIPGRKDLVKEKGKEKKTDNNSLVKKYNSRYCAMTKETLKKPIMGDKLGFLYNKEPMIRALIEKRLPRNFMHISSLKDLKNLNITLSNDEESKIICPITMLEFSGLNSFYILWKCGCVLSKKAVEELEMSSKCINCSSEVNLKSDLISLNYTSKERETIFKQIIQEKIKKQKDSKSINSLEGDCKLSKLLCKKTTSNDNDFYNERDGMTKNLKKQKLEDHIII